MAGRARLVARADLRVGIGLYEGEGRCVACMGRSPVEACVQLGSGRVLPIHAACLDGASVRQPLSPGQQLVAGGLLGFIGALLGQTVAESFVGPMPTRRRRLIPPPPRERREEKIIDAEFVVDPVPED